MGFFLKFDLWLRTIFMAKNPSELFEIPISNLPPLPPRKWSQLISSEMKWTVALIIALLIEYFVCQSDEKILLTIFCFSTFTIFLGPVNNLHPESIHHVNKYPGPKIHNFQHNSNPADYIERMKKSLPCEAIIMTNPSWRYKMPWNSHLHDKYKFVISVSMESHKITSALAHYTTETVVSANIIFSTFYKDNGYIVYAKTLNGDRNVIVYVMNQMSKKLN